MQGRHLNTREMVLSGRSRGRRKNTWPTEPYNLGLYVAQAFLQLLLAVGLSTVSELPTYIPASPPVNTAIPSLRSVCPGFNPANQTQRVDCAVDGQWLLVCERVRGDLMGSDWSSSTISGGISTQPRNELLHNSFTCCASFLACEFCRPEISS